MQCPYNAESSNRWLLQFFIARNDRWANTLWELQFFTITHPPLSPLSVDLNSFVLAQAVALCFALAIGLVLLYRFAFLGARWTLGSFPMRHLVIVAFLDMLHLVPVIVAAADVAPTLTVLLIQCSAPFCIATGTLFCMK